jgi:hypothetical protein
VVAALSWVAAGIVAAGTVLGVAAAWFEMRAGGVPRPGRRVAGPAVLAAVGVLSAVVVPLVALPLVLAACLWLLIGAQTGGGRPSVVSAAHPG